MTDPAQIARGLTKAQRDAVQSIAQVRGVRNGLFWACNDADLLADLSHIGLCKLPFVDNKAVCSWQFAARIKPLGLAVRAELEKMK